MLPIAFMEATMTGRRVSEGLGALNDHAPMFSIRTVILLNNSTVWRRPGSGKVTGYCRSSMARRTSWTGSYTLISIIGT